ncbi:MAG: type 1 glutamine amidotransferase [Gemmatimonadales bacterium]
MRFVVLQHLPCEHPGIFRDFMRDDGVETVTVELSEGGQIPPPEETDALLVFGGPMNVDEEERYPWLVPETRAIRQAAWAGTPILGVCLGAQLLAKALGAPVTRTAEPEVGLLEVELTAAGIADPLFQGWPRRASVVQWHSDTFGIPADAVRLASSPACPNQAFRYGDSAYGLQFHPEVTGEMAKEWSENPEYAAALQQIEQRTGVSPFGAVPAASDRLRAQARLIYHNFRTLARRAAGV